MRKSEHPISTKKYSPTKYSRLTWRTKEIKNYIYQFRTKLTKAESENQNYSKVPDGEIKQ